MDRRRAHDVLGVKPGSSAQDIKSAYRKLAMKHHPDKGGDESKFKDINQAHDILVNNKGQSSPIPHNHQQADGRQVHVSAAKRKSKKNKTVLKMFNLTLEEAYVGVEKKLSMQYQKPCSCCSECNTCEGCGMIIIEQRRQVGFTTFMSSSTARCHTCGGKGIVIHDQNCNKCKSSRNLNATEIVSIRFPPRTKPGYFKTLLNAIPKFDVSIKVSLAPHDAFQYRAGELYSTVELDLFDAIFGKNVLLTHPSGEKMELDTGSLGVVINAQHEYRIPNKGFLQGKDLVIKFDVEQPTHETNLIELKRRNPERLEICKSVMRSILKKSQ